MKKMLILSILTLAFGSASVSLAAQRGGRPEARGEVTLTAKGRVVEAKLAELQIPNADARKVAERVSDPKSGLEPIVTAIIERSKKTGTKDAEIANDQLRLLAKSEVQVDAIAGDRVASEAMENLISIETKNWSEDQMNNLQSLISKTIQNGGTPDALRTAVEQMRLANPKLAQQYKSVDDLLRAIKELCKS